MAQQPLNVERLQHGLEDASLPYVVSYHPTSRSTQIDAMALIQAHGPTSWLVVSERQEQGRGRSGRAWLSDSGDLAATWTLPLDFSPQRWGKLSLLGGLIAAEAISREFGIETQVKWPNDLYLDSKKFGGCLGEAMTTIRGPVALLGIGINLLPKDPARLPEPPIYPMTYLDVQQESDPRVPLLLAISKLVHERSNWVGTDHDQQLSDWWRSRSLMFRKHARMVGSGSAMIAGIVLGITPTGALIVESPDGQQHVITAGDVHLAEI